jgi:hypothetical protein
MSNQGKNDRPPKDLSVPETMRIAALLAELMPPATESGAAAAPVEVADEPPVSELGPPALRLEELEEAGAVSFTDPPPSDWAESPLDRALPPQEPAAPPSEPRAFIPVEKPGSRQGLKPIADVPATAKSDSALLRPPPLPKVDPAPAASAELETEFWQPKKGGFKPAPPKTPSKAPLDPDLIPLGDLSAGSFFSLVNWRNEPERARHPRRADYGLDEQTLALASRNPFYVVGRPRRPEERSVSEVLSEIVWE